MKQAKDDLPTRLEAGGVCIQGQDWGDINVARIRFPAGADEVYYWPPGHTVRVDEDYEAIEFSPSAEMGELIEHLAAKLKG